MNVSLRDATTEDVDFAFEAKKQAMGPHIISKWGWDEGFQITIHKQRWSEKTLFILVMNNEEIGTVSIQNVEGKLRFGEFYLLNKFRNQGIGTGVLKEFLIECDKNYKTVVLEYLKWNPVGSLYKRNSFKIIDENEIHYFMVREPQSH
jgi:predicted acetyltransferase